MWWITTWKHLWYSTFYINRGHQVCELSNRTQTPGEVKFTFIIELLSNWNRKETLMPILHPYSVLLVGGLLRPYGRMPWPPSFCRAVKCNHIFCRRASHTGSRWVGRASDVILYKWFNRYQEGLTSDHSVPSLLADQWSPRTGKLAPGCKSPNKIPMMKEPGDTIQGIANLRKGSHSPCTYVWSISGMQLTQQKGSEVWKRKVNKLPKAPPDQSDTPLGIHLPLWWHVASNETSHRRG